MPHIFDNIEQLLLTALQETLNVADGRRTLADQMKSVNISKIG